MSTVVPFIYFGLETVDFPVLYRYSKLKPQRDQLPAATSDTVVLFCLEKLLITPPDHERAEVAESTHPLGPLLPWVPKVAPPHVHLSSWF